MKRLQITPAVLFAGAVLMAAPLDARAQGSDDARPISLADAIKQAQRNSPAVIQARGLQRNGVAARRSALGQYLPTLNFTMGTAQTKGVQYFQGALVPLTGNPWNYNNAITTNLQLFDGFSRYQELKRVGATQVVADLTTVQTQFDAELSVKQQYFAALAARESESAAKAQLEQAEQQLKASAARVAAGVATKSDSLRSVIQVGNAQLAVLTAQNDLRVANASLTRVVGSDATVTAIAEDTADVLAPIPGEAELEKMLADGPAVLLAGANVEAAKASKRSQRSSYLPTINMSYSFNLTQGSSAFSPSDVWLLTGSSPNRKNLNFNLSYPIFNGFTRETQSVNLDVALRNAEAQARDARLAARANLTSLLRAAQNAEARVRVQQQAINAADEDLRVQQQRYALGASTLLDLLASQTALNQARQSLIQARFDGRVARAQLAALLGKPL